MVTGAAGSIGGWVLRNLILEGVEAGDFQAITASNKQVLAWVQEARKGVSPI